MSPDREPDAVLAAGRVPADDPRRPVLMRRIAYDQADEAHWQTYGEIADRYLAALDAADPLRALLADEDRAVEFAARARYEDFVQGWPVAESWDEVTDETRQAWRHSVKNLLPVLAALRSVAGWPA